MLKFFRSKKGFTLVELMVVCIIVAILAAVAIPLMGANKKRAYATEAEATLGMIRSVLRTYRAEHTAYPTQATAAVVTSVAALGITATDLIGNYFSDACYDYQSANGTDFTIRCVWANSVVPNNTATPPTSGAIKAADVNAFSPSPITSFTESNGEFTRTNY